MRLLCTVSARIVNMRGFGLITLFSLLVFLITSTKALFFNNRPHPTYSLENMPDTDFTCRDKVLGGYYADFETQCQMFHICVKVAGVGVQDFRFLCPNGTAFDQDHQICAEWDDVDCDATTLYYSSDNFDLYRIGSGFESKAVKYGEEEEPFALQRAETGDIRLNREKETQRINQQPEPRPFRKTNPSSRPTQSKNNNLRNNNNNNDNNNNNNNENENKEIFRGSSSGHFFNNRNKGKEYEEDYDDGNYNSNQNGDRFQARKQQSNRKPIRNQHKNNDQFDDVQPSTRRPVGYSNNFAGSSYVPTTSRPKTTPTSSGRQNNNYQQNNQFNNQQNNNQNQYTVSTPAPFKQTQQYNTPYRRTTVTKQEEARTENYPKQSPTSSTSGKVSQTYYNTQYRTQTTASENYPSTNKFENQKQKLPKKTEATTTLPKNTLPQKTSTNNNFNGNNYPSTFSPRINAGIVQLNQQSTTKQQQQQNISSNNQSPQKQTTTTQFTQYTPTVPKVTTKQYTTTQQPKYSNRYDETQYDDSDGDSRDEFLSVAHSTNIANSRNELQKVLRSSTTSQKPRPFSLTTARTTTQVTQNPAFQSSPKTIFKSKPKDYDYAYYDTNVSEEDDYEVHADIKKSEKKQ